MLSVRLENGREMYREEVIKLMTEMVNKINYDRGAQMGLTAEQIKMAVDQSIPEITQINSMLYDLLVDNGVIKN